MRIVRTQRELRSALATAPGPVGFVPTMGYLHAGHLSLVRAARAENQTVVVSVFVNPTQFGPGEDLAAYPRDLERDLNLLEPEGVALMFAPSAEEMYPEGTSTVVDPGPLAQVLEGAARPGHFRGVATVVLKLLNIVQPGQVFFGAKDAQQVAVIRRIVRDLSVPVEVVECPTVRELDGLAMSSRNVYLTAEQRRAATALYRGLVRAQQAWLGGEREAERLRSLVCNEVAKEPTLEPEYVSVAHPQTLQELKRVDEAGALLSLAVRAGSARLIDNLRLVYTDREGA